jgi:hypothetical protein
MQPTPRNSDRAVTLAVAAPILLLFVPLLVPMLTQRVFAHTDLGAFHLPLRRIFAAALQSGDSIAWTSQMFNGFYLHAEGQVGALHPLHLLLYRFVPLTTAFNLEVIASYVFAFVGMWLFLRHLGASVLSTAIGSIAFAFSGFQVLHLGHPNAVAIAAHVPWLLLAIDAAWSASTTTRAAGAAGISLITASEVLLGYPQYVWLSSLACGIYAVVAGPSWRALWLPAVAGLAGLTMGAIQLLPTLDLLGGSSRAAAAPEFRLTFSLHPLNLLQLWSPYVLPSRVHAAAEELYVHEFGVYNGALCTVAAAWALLRRGRLPFGRLSKFAGTLCVAGIVLALGKYSGVYTALSALPVLDVFRAPARHLLLVHLGLALFAAVMIEDLARMGRDRAELRRVRARIAAPLVLSGVTAVLAVIWWSVSDRSSIPAIYPAAVLVGTGFIAATTTLVRDAARGVRAALLVVPLLLAIDLGFWGYSYAWGSAPMSIGEIAALAPEPPADHPAKNLHDAEDRPSRNYWLLHDARVARPYVGLSPQFSLPLTDEQALRLAGVEWVRTGTGWRQIENPMARLRVVPSARFSQDPAADLTSIRIEETALADRRISTRLARPADASLRLLADRPGRLDIDVDAPDPVLLATTESYHPGWRAETDASTAVPLRLYGDYLGVLVPAGHVRLALRFDPPSLRYGSYASCAGVLATALLFVLVRRRSLP